MTDKNIQMTQRNSDNSSWDNLYPNTKTGNIVDLPLVWNDLALRNGATGTIRYAKDAIGNVYVRLYLSGTPVNSFATLPVGYRPITDFMIYCGVGSYNYDAHAKFHINEGGDMEITYASSPGDLSANFRENFSFQTGG